MKRILFFLLVTSFFSNCKGDKTENDLNNGNASEKPLESKEHYFHLKGTIKEIPITMNLIHRINENPAEYESTESYSGIYFYDKYMEPINLYHEPLDSANVLKMNEWSSDDVVNSFIGNFETPFSFKGDWQNGLRQFSLPFSLRTSYPEGTIPLSFQSWKAHQFADSTKQTGPGVTYSIGALWPKEDNQFLREEILKILAETDDLRGYESNTPAELFEEMKADYFAEYVEMVNDFLQVDGAHIPNYDNNLDMFVVWNEDSVLVLGANYYMYEGGAHGMFTTQYFNFDLKTNSRITLTDVFKDNYEKTLTLSLNNALRRKYDLQSDQSILDIVDVDQIPVTTNFFLTGGGIGFYYPPYELGPWAAGDFQFFVHFDDIEDVVKVELLERI